MNRVLFAVLLVPLFILFAARSDAQWKLQKTFPGAVTVAYFVDGPGSPTVGFAGGSRYLYRTSDGGNTWQDVTPPTLTGSVSDITFADANLGWCCVRTGLLDSLGALFRTHDGGLTWQPLGLRGGDNVNV